MTTTLRNLLLIVLLGLSGVAFANDFDTAYDAGNAAFDAKDYAKARAEFLKAYDLRPEPIILYNIAQTYRLESNTKMAVEYYRKYLADSKSAQDLRKKAEDYVKDLEERAKVEKKPTDVVDVPRDKGTAITPPTTTMTTPTGPTGPTDVVRKRHIPLGSKIAAGVTGAGVIASLILTKRGLDIEKDFDNLGTMATPDDAKKVESAQNLINISWGITGAAAVTSVVIYFAAPSYSTDRKTVVVAPTRDGGWTAALTGRF